MEPTQQKSSPALPIAIITGFAMIAIAIFFTSQQNTPGSAVTTTENPAGETTVTGTPRTVDSSDYILGNPNAPIVMIEYSDYDCPFCKQYHQTMHQIMDEYGVTGRIAWVYRQFPLVQLHPNAAKISEAALCVGDIGGNTAFWTFTDLIFGERDLDEQTNVTKLATYAQQSGISQSDYSACLDSGRMQESVVASIEDAFNAGARSTPYTVLIVGNQQAVISGAQSYTTVKAIIDNLLEQLDGTFDPSATTTPQIPVNASGVPILE